MASAGTLVFQRGLFGQLVQEPDFSSRKRAARVRVCASSSSSSSNKSSSSPSSVVTTTPPATDPALTLPIKRDIPGSYGLPVLGSISDRLNYFWFQGIAGFLKTRAAKYKSTIFRANVPPGSPFFPDPRVIVLLDQKSFPVLFDVKKVDKRDVFTGTFTPSLDYTGGYRILSYLDVDEPRHAQLKGFCFDMLKTRAPKVLPELHTACSRFFDVWEDTLAKTGAADVNSTLSLIFLSFLTKCFLDDDATLPSGLGDQGPELITKWTGFQLAPVLDRVAGLPPPLEELLFHTFPLPFALVKDAYSKIVSYFSKHSGPLLDLAQEQHGVPRDEALHNLIFLICFNTLGGLARLIPTALHAARGESRELGAEIRSAVASSGGKLSFKALENMPLLHSFVFEVMRYSPPVPVQYGRAREDMIITSHQEAFKVKKGEMLCGFQPFVVRDPAVFDRPNEFIARRFLGEEGERLLQHLFWSNGPESESPGVDNKQCAGKNFIILVTRAFLAEFFLRYESFQMDGPVTKGAQKVYTIGSLSRA